MRPSAWSSRADRRIRDTCVLLALLLAGCSTTRREIRSAPPTKNIAQLESERSWVREEAALALGDKRVVEAVPRLETMARATADRDYVRAAAVDALGRIGQPGSLEVLAGIAAERGAPPALQLAVIEAICRYQPQEPTAIRALAPLIEHPDLLVSAAAKKEVGAGCVP